MIDAGPGRWTPGLVTKAPRSVSGQLWGKLPSVGAETRGLGRIRTEEAVR